MPDKGTTSASLGRRLLHFPLARFVVSGAAAAVVDLLVFAALNFWMGWPWFSCHAVSRPSGGVVSFLLNKLWTFGRPELCGSGRQALRYLVLWLASFTLSGAFLRGYLWLLPEWCGADLLAKAAAEITVGLLSFGTQRFWVFRLPKPS